MATTSWNLSYAGETFALTDVDGKKLRTLLGAGNNGDWLWTFTPNDSDEEIAITVGSGIPLILRKAPSL